MQAADGETFKAVLSEPPTGRGPGILLIQEIFGVDEHIRAVADDYAAQGYLAIAPALFDRVRPGTTGYAGCRTKGTRFSIGAVRGGGRRGGQMSAVTTILRRLNQGDRIPRLVVVVDELYK